MLTLALPDPWEPDWKWLVPRVEGIYDGTIKDEVTWSPDTKDWLTRDQYKSNLPKPGFFYANLQMPIRPWFLENIIRGDSHPRTAEVQPMTFFG